MCSRIAADTVRYREAPGLNSNSPWLYIQSEARQDIAFHLRRQTLPKAPARFFCLPAWWRGGTLAAMRLSTFLFRAARASRDVEAVSSGKPRRVARRAKNIAAGRALRRVGFWRWLWK